MTVTMKKPEVSNGAPGAVEGNVPAAAPESASASSATPVSATLSPEAALVGDVLSGAAPAAGNVAVKPDNGEDTGEELTVEEQFSQFDKDFDAVHEEEVVSPPEPTTATPAKPAENVPPVTAVQAAAAQESTPQPAAGAASERAQPATPVEEFPDLFANVPQPAVAPASETPATGAPAVQTATPPATPAEETAAQRLARLRTEQISKLETLYAFGDEDARAVMLEPEKVLPKQFARLHTEVTESVVSGILNQLPALVHQTLQSMRGQQQLNRSFFQTWPQLSKPEHVGTARGLLQAYRQQNPTAAWDQVVREVGAAAMIALRLPLPPEMMGAAAPAASPASMPVTPANPGAGTPINSGVPQNEFVRMNADWDSEEDIS